MTNRVKKGSRKDQEEIEIAPLAVQLRKKSAEKYTEGRQFGILGEPGVNILLLNLALDRIQ